MTTKMMIAPGLDGKPHPMFKCEGDIAFYRHGSSWIRFCICGEDLLPASAIANFWHDGWIRASKEYEKTPGATDLCYAKYKKVSIAHDQLHIWKRAARGETIENAVIVPMEWE